MVRGPTTLASRSRSKRQPSSSAGKGPARDTDSEPDTVDDARIGGVGDDHFVSGIDGAEEDVKRF